MGGCLRDELKNTMGAIGRLLAHTEAIGVSSTDFLPAFMVLDLPRSLKSRRSLIFL